MSLGETFKKDNRELTFTSTMLAQYSVSTHHDHNARIILKIKDRKFSDTLLIQRWSLCPNLLDLSGLYFHSAQKNVAEVTLRQVPKPGLMKVAVSILCHLEHRLWEHWTSNPHTTMLMQPDVGIPAESST